MKRLQNFILEQMQKMGRDEGSGHELSMSEFARRIGVSPSAISRLLDDDPPFPKVEFLIKLAEGTETDIRDVITLISPESVIKGYQPDLAVLALRLSQLSENDREIIDNFITGALAKKK